MSILKCFLTVRPSEKFYNFVKNLPDIDNIYICIDDNDYDIPNYDNKIKIIKINNKESYDYGFHSTVKDLKNKASSRDKALYFFYKNNLNFKYIWFLEEDVFIPNTMTIKNIDNKYPYQDLLVSSNVIVDTYKKDWLWNIVNKQLKNKLNLPFAKSMICAIRCSKKLLKCIYSYVLKHKCLFLDEALFNTIALHNKLKIKVIKELQNIFWKKDNGWKKNEINENYLYHPIKCIEKQYQLRNNK